MERQEKLIRVCVASVEADERLGLATIVAAQPDMEVIGQAGSIAQVLDGRESGVPDVLVVDSGLVNAGTAETVARYQTRHPECRLLLIGMHPADERGIRAESQGYLLKGMSHQELAEAIRTVHRGSVYLPRRPVRSMR